MNSLLDPTATAEITRRINNLTPTTGRQWGTMNVDQMLAHCVVPFGVPLGESVIKRSLAGILMGSFIKKVVLDPKPYKQNLPTDKAFVVKGARDFEKEKTLLLHTIDRFSKAKHNDLADRVHPFFGRLTAEQWGGAMWKHLDHHLRQFGA